MREYYYDEKEIKREREEMSRLLSDKKQQYVSTRAGRGFARTMWASFPPPRGPGRCPAVSPLPWAHTTQERVLLGWPGQGLGEGGTHRGPWRWP